MTGTVRVRLSPLRPNSSSAHVHDDEQVAVRTAARTRLALAGQLDPLPVRDPAGMRVVSRRVYRTVRSPWQVGHGSSMIE